MEKIYLERYEDGDPCSSWTTPDCLNDVQVKELYTLIGQAIFMFNSVESSLDYIIADAVNVSSRVPGYVITAETSVFTKKIALFKSLLGMAVQGYEQNVTNLFDSVLKNLYKIKDVRNDIAHANWMSSDEDYRVRIRLSMDEKGVYPVIKTLSPKYLKRSIDSMQKVLEDLELFSMEIDDLFNVQIIDEQ